MAQSTGLLWGLDFLPDGARDIALDAPRVQGVFRWVHLNLSDAAAHEWIMGATWLPASVREAMLAHEAYQNSFVEADTLCCVLQDFRRELDGHHSDRPGTLHVALTKDMMITARRHPLGFSDHLRRHFAERAQAMNPARALDFLVSAILEHQSHFIARLFVQAQKAEDAVLAGQAPPESRELLELRRRLSVIHRMLDGMKRVLQRLEEDDDLPDSMADTVERISQRTLGQAEEVAAIQAQVRLLREELDLAANQRINRNLYVLSVLTVLLMPATLVTGFFGMNTGDLPFQKAMGTWGAALLALGASTATWLYLRRGDFFK